MSDTNSAVIVGAGIAGLCTAIALRRKHYAVTVCERNLVLSEAGAGIQLAPNATRVLHAMGLAGALKKIGTTPSGGGVRVANSGRYIIRPSSQLNKTGFPYYQCHRADLLAILEKHAKDLGVQFQLGVSFQRYEQDETGVNVDFSEGLQLRSQLLIGADGVRSQVREQMFGADKPVFTGNVAWRGLVPARALKEPIEPSIFLGPGKHFVCYYVRGGELLNFVAIEERDDWSDESWTQRGDVSSLRQAYAGWNEQISDILDNVEECFQWALFSRKPLPKWSDGRVVAIGDAVHPSLPNLAQGAGMAIEDAYVLADAIAYHGADVTAALTHFYRLRIDRCSRIQAASADMAKLLHSPSGLVQFLKFTPAALLSRIWPELIARKVTWAHGYDATDQFPENTAGRL